MSALVENQELPTTELPKEEVVKEPEEEKQEDVLEVIMPSADPREQKIVNENGDTIATFIQKPLTYFGKMQFFKLLAEGLKRSIDEGGAEVVADLFGGTTGRDLTSLSQTDFADAGSFMRFVLSVVEQGEDLLERAYMIWLGVPPHQRDYVRSAMRGDLEGVVPLSDEDGIAILKTFVVQNWNAMQVFFKEHVKDVFEIAKAEQKRLSK